MEAKREQALVGLFVLIVAAVLVATVFALSGAFGRPTTTYRAYFTFAEGVGPGTEVRYAGGPRVGRVEHTRLDPQDPSHIEITFGVRPDVPVKTDSVVKILSLSALGDYHVEIIPGSAQAPRAQSGAVLPSEPPIGFNDLAGQVNALGPEAKQLLQSLNQRATELQVTIARVNDLLSDRNRTNLAASLGHIRGLLEEDRPKVRSTLTHLDAASDKLEPALDDLRKTAQQANQALVHFDEIMAENRPDLHQALVELRQTLAAASSLTMQLDRTLNVNSENIDELLENLRHTSENLKQFTDTIKSRPYTLIRAANPPERKPGAPH